VIAQGLGDAQWNSYSDTQRMTRLRDAIRKDEGPAAALDPSGRRSLWVFEAISHCRNRYGPDAIGPYVVSGTRGVDDVLSVLLLAHWADIADHRTGDVPVDITPLFETAEALSNCGEIIAGLLNEPLYQRHLTGRRNHQFVMLGYSSSNKECGAVSSQWLLHLAQESLVRVAADAKVDLTIFHGRGNTVVRNAGLVETLARIMPDGAMRNRVRLTEQGELINDKYSLRPIALRVFEQAFGALTLASADVHTRQQQKEEWRLLMDLMSKVSRRTYHELINEDAQFFEFFRLATPIDVIERMQIGSRSTWRDAQTSIRDISAVPWSYAWAQSRYMLPSWYGAGNALEAASREFGENMLSEMYSRWFFFENLIDQVEMGLARADMDIAHFYDDLAGPQFERITSTIRREYELAKKHILKLKGCVRLLDGEPTLQRSIRLRNPYLDPMHLMQVDLLSRWRASGRQDKEKLAALLASVNGIAHGLQGSS
jgi:phosphoenolpyruvate carboxylase